MKIAIEQNKIGIGKNAIIVNELVFWNDRLFGELKEETVERQIDEYECVRECRLNCVSINCLLD